MTHNEALRILETTGDEQAAFTWAKYDGGLLPHVTFEQWLPYARNCIARRAAEAAMPPAYYG